MDDRWLYDEVSFDQGLKLLDLKDVKPEIISKGDDLTIVGSGYTVKKIIDCKKEISNLGLEPEIIDLRILNPIDYNIILKSVEKTGRLLVVDGDWSSCGIAAEVICTVTEELSPSIFKSKPMRLTLEDAPAPTSKVLEEDYFISKERIIEATKKLI